MSKKAKPSGHFAIVQSGLIICASVIEKRARWVKHEKRSARKLPKLLRLMLVQVQKTAT